MASRDNTGYRLNIEFETVTVHLVFLLNPFLTMERHIVSHNLVVFYCVKVTNNARSIYCIIFGGIE